MQIANPWRERKVWNYVMNCWMQVKVYSGIIMPEIQRMTRWGSLFCNIMTRCGIVLQYFTPQLRPFTSWQVTLSAHCQAHWESGEGEAKIPSQGFVQQLKQVNQVWLNSLIPIPIKTQLASATSAPLCFWRDSLSSDDEKKAKKKSNGKGVEGVACIAYQLNFEQTSQTLVVTILQCRSPLAFIDGPSQWVIN